MSKESFSWRSLFINDNTEPSANNEEKIPSTLPIEEKKFPVESSILNSNNNSPNQYVGEILDVYEKGFESLNMEGFDFFELYKSVVAVGITNPQSYHMAFTMGKTLKSDLSKEFLLQKSAYYLGEIEKVYQKYDTTGKAKKNDLDIDITRDKVNLTKSISDLESEILRLQKDLESKKLELSQIDTNSMSLYNEIQLKIEANDFAKRKIVDSINTVIAGINQYL